MKRFISLLMIVVMCTCLFTFMPNTRVDAFNASTLPTIGIGLGHPVYYTTQWAFVDAVKMLNQWKQFGQLDINGWPKSCASGYTEVYGGVFLGGHNPVGNYVLTWEGDGDVVVESTTTSLVSENLNSNPKRRVYNIGVEEDGLKIVIKSFPANYAKNIKLWMPGFENASSPFHPLFVERLRPFGVLRFMDWGHTNNSKQVTWSSRKLPTYAQQNELPELNGGQYGGVAYEYMIQLCNEIGSNMWVCVPHMADDNYVTQLATLIKNNLNPNLKVYIEYSNEIWNWGFKQSTWVRDNFNFGSLEANAANRAKQIFKIFENVFEGRSRMVRVFSGRAAFASYLEKALPSINPATDIDVLAIATYFSHEMSTYIWDNNLHANINETNLKKAFDEFQNRIGTGPFKTTDIYKMGGFADNFALAKQYGLPVIAYEGGTHFIPETSAQENDVDFVEFIKAMNRHPRIKDIYRTFLERWKQSGGLMHNAFVDASNWGKHGCWGHLEYQDQPLNEAPKYEFLLEWKAYLENNTSTPTPTPTPTSTPTPTVTPTPPGGSVLFADGFESNNFTAGGWTTSDGTPKTSTIAYEGSYSAALNYKDAIDKSQSTAGYTGVQVKYARKSEGINSSGYFAAEWYDGSTWNTLENITGYASGNYEYKTWSLPAAANNNSNFAVRFRTSGAGANNVYIDSVEISSGAAAVTPTPTPIPTSSPTPTPNPTPVSTTLFSDGFESGNYTTGGWTSTSGSEIKNTGAYEGTYCSAINYNDYIEKAVSTSGSSNIQVKYVCKSEGVVSTGQFISEWYDGSMWNTIESITGYTSSSYQVKSFSLPAAAANKAGFKLRFKCINAGSGRVYIDNVKIIAQN